MDKKYNPVGWFEIYVQDMNRAKKFYEQTFEVTLQDLGNPGIEMWAFPMIQDAPGCTGALVKYSGKDSGGGGTIVYFPVPDCGTKATEAVKNGGKIQKEKMSIGQHGFISLVYDTEGNMIGLHSMK
jgi:predicted enzyme related to lactoylglutathione lyase